MSACADINDYKLTIFTSASRSVLKIRSHVGYCVCGQKEFKLKIIDGTGWRTPSAQVDAIVLGAQVFQRQLSKEGLQNVVNSKADGAGSSSFSSEELRDLFTLRTSTLSDTYDSLCCGDDGDGGVPPEGAPDGEGLSGMDTAKGSIRRLQVRKSGMFMR